MTDIDPIDEAVARSLCQAMLRIWWREVDDKTLGDGVESWWRAQLPVARIVRLSHERALLAAGMVIVPREPTAAMVENGRMAAPFGYDAREMADCWRAMVDAALEEKA